ncbi:MAG TPA: Ku protein [Pyrinomonadaceae bacterium]|nr:Ku protein [Pyrinomonadaceae bacterium]
MRPFWSGTITFGLVSVPVNLFPATRSIRTSLRMLGPDGEPLARKYYAEKTGKDLEADDMVRGYEVDDGKFVTVTDEELERLAPEKTRDIDLKRFVKEDAIPPVYFERGYFLTPAGNSEKAYRLLAEAMKERGDVGIATFVMRGKERIVAIFSDQGLLRAETMRFPNEVRSVKAVGLPEKKDVSAASVRKFENLIKKKARRTFSPDKDQQTEGLLKLVKRKQSKASNVVELKNYRRDKEPEEVDLIQVLKRSLAGKR